MPIVVFLLRHWYILFVILIILYVIREKNIEKGDKNGRRKNNKA